MSHEAFSLGAASDIWIQHTQAPVMGPLYGEDYSLNPISIHSQDQLSAMTVAELTYEVYKGHDLVAELPYEV